MLLQAVSVIGHVLKHWQAKTNFLVPPQTVWIGNPLFLLFISIYWIPLFLFIFLFSFLHHRHLLSLPLHFFCVLHSCSLATFPIWFSTYFNLFFLPTSPIPGERDSLLSRLADLLSSTSPTIGIHFEMASFVEESIMEDLLHYVIPHVCISYIDLHVTEMTRVFAKW